MDTNTLAYTLTRNIDSSKIQTHTHTQTLQQKQIVTNNLLQFDIHRNISGN